MKENKRMVKQNNTLRQNVVSKHIASILIGTIPSAKRTHEKFGSGRSRQTKGPIYEL